jgi:uncharacterized protein YggE
MKRFAFLFALPLLVVSAAAQPSEMRPLRDTVAVSAQGKFEAAPDTALIQFRISAQEPQLKAAHERASRAAEQVRQVLRDNGIPPKEAEIGFLRVSPVYEWKPQRKLVGYVVDSEIQVRVHDFAKIGPLEQSFTAMDVTSDQSITYTIDDTDAAKLKAIESAYGKARARAQALASLGGRTLGEMVRASVADEEFARPIPMMAKMNAMGAAAPATAEFTPAKITITSTVTVDFLLK